ncbi:U6 snRNA phosphodiesterase-like [Chenopodium quinoa]|uniref:U6 snRNA phosphodiesterase-like n=1 Tax=Chenopodium quinoa TaxID=63459 RepID=UPI000B789118|nr:U6 snRNA phosphodiesterase-like [Chenopodium quinoa]
MDALLASYGDSDSDSDSDSNSNSSTPVSIPPQNPPPSQSPSPSPLPPPPLSLLTPPNSLLGTIDNLQTGQPARVRSFPHVEGNYAVHVYIPVFIPQPARKEASQFIKKVSSSVPGLHVIDADIPLENILNDDQKLEHIALGREFHISLGRTVPIRVHQIDSMVTMLRQKLQIQKRYWIDFNKWEVFVNDDHTRAFLSLEVTTGGLPEITKQIQAVNEAYRLHNLPEFYKDPRPHISLTWASGDTSDLLRRVVEEAKKHPEGRNSLQKRVFTAKFSGIECKIGSKTYKICKLPDD